MAMRDGLIDLLIEAKREGSETAQADYLIANGVILPPCKVGDKVYLVCRNRNTMEWYISEENVYSISAYNNGIEIYITPIVSFTEMEIGVRLFLAKEEAEKALKERESDG